MVPPIPSHDTADLQQENALLWDILARESIALVGVDGEGKIDLWSAPAEGLFGWSMAEVLGRAPPFIGEEALQATLERWRGGEGAGLHEVPATHKDGTPLTVSMVPAGARGVDGARGRVVIAVTRAGSDATRRGEAHEELRKSEERYRVVAHATQDAIYDFDMVTNGVWRNESFDRISGDPGSRFADGDWWRNRIHPDDRATAFSAFEEALATGGNSWVSEYRLLHSSGHYVTLRDRGAIIWDDQGRPVRVIGAVMDVSEQRRLERQVQETLARLKEAAEELKSKNAMLEVEVSERARREASLRRQKEEIELLSAPIVQVWDKVLALPVIGTVDRERSRAIMDKLLGEIVRTQSSFAILDLTGIAHVDTDTAKHLLDIVRAARLLGSTTLLSGIAPGIAQTMVEMGIETSAVTTFGTLRDALEHALASTRTAGRARSLRGAGRSGRG